MKTKMKCAIIGYGYWGHIVERYLINSEKFYLAYIYDPSITNQISLEIILNDNEIEAAFICTPIETHYEMTKLLLQHNKHVFCEKPLTKTLILAEELAKLAINKNKCLYTDYIYTVSPSINFIKDKLESIGTIIDIEGEILQFGNFYENDSVDDVLAVHMFSIILYLLDKKKDIDVEKVITIRSDKHNLLECKIVLKSLFVSKITFICSLVSDTKSRRVCIRGEKGNLVFDMLGEFTAKQFLVEKQEVGYRILKENNKKFDEKNNLELAINKFYDEIKRFSNGNLLMSLAVTDLLERFKHYTNTNL